MDVLLRLSVCHSVWRGGLGRAHRDVVVLEREQLLAAISPVGSQALCRIARRAAGHQLLFFTTVQVHPSAIVATVAVSM